MADVIQATRFYIDKIVADPKIGGMKVLLLDPYTTQIVSTVYSQTDILEKEVYLVEQLGHGSADHEPMTHLKAAVFLQPTRSNLELLRRELAHPKYLEYHLFFSHIVPQDLLQQLAEADEFEVVRQVQEYYADFVAINEDLFTINQRGSLSLGSEARSEATQTNGAQAKLQQNVSAILSVLLALRKKPSQIRYQGQSGLCRQVAAEVNSQIQSDGIFDFRRHEGPMLLILDRRDDPVTPLLSQWTYQAMVHELLGLNNNRTLLKGAPGVRKDLEEVVLSPTQDEFFCRNRNSNFGDVGMAVKALVDSFQQESKMNENISSIEDMQAFLERYPKFRAQSLNVSKHVALLSELGRLVDVCGLMDLSQLEQDLACNEDHANQYRALMDKLQDMRVKVADKLRLALLYAVRYETSGNLRSVRAALQDSGIGPDRATLVDTVLEYAGQNRRAGGLYGPSSFISKIGKQIQNSLVDVQNVYTQHVPLLMNTLDVALKGRLRENQFPAVGAALNTKPPDIIVFILGGVTFEEACKVAELNAQLAGTQRVILGGSCIHNSTSFLEDLTDFSHSAQGSNGSTI
mmetsp:Transcript_31700/g.41897  ORF Transcript_31700/g.41897 Transcript_31700/m.41897 type:complete len:574 (+) Transcript_31700:80-1801(+)